MYEPHVTLLATVVAPPRHIVTESGVPLLTLRLAATPRWYDKTSGEWRDGETWYVNATCWRALADNVAASVRTGTPVLVSGRLRIRSWDDKSGSRRSALEVEAFSVGHDLTRGVATFQRAPARGARTGGQGGAAEVTHEWRVAGARQNGPDGARDEAAERADPNAA